jgi:lysozyme
MMLSEPGLNFIKRHEGFVDHVYVLLGVPHIGYGHRIRPGEVFPDRISMDEGLSILAADTQLAQDAVNSTVKVPLSQPQFDALVSLVFNWGGTNWRKSSHLKYLNAGDYQKTAQRISEHPITSQGKTVPTLIKRRQEEAALFRSGMMDVGTPAMIDAGEETDTDISEDEEQDYTTYLLGGMAVVLGFLLISKFK